MTQFAVGSKIIFWTESGYPLAFMMILDAFEFMLTLLSLGIQFLVITAIDAEMLSPVVDKGSGSLALNQDELVIPGCAQNPCSFVPLVLMAEKSCSLVLSLLHGC